MGWGVGNDAVCANQNMGGTRVAVAESQWAHRKVRIFFRNETRIHSLSRLKNR